MAKKRVRKRKKRIRFRRSVILPFVITLTAVAAAGVLALAAHRWITEPVRDGLTEMVNMEQEKAETAQIPEPVVEEPEEESVPEEEETEPPSRYQSELEDPSFLAENNIYVREPSVPGQVTLTFAGDVLFDDRYAITGPVRADGDISKGVLPEVIERMQAADVMMLNNEFAYSNRGTPIEEKQFTFRARPETAAYLQDMGVDLVSLANNHAYDYGPDALTDTLDTLREAQIPYVGAGRDIDEARKPVYYIVGDLKIAFVSATQIERLDTPDTKEATADSPGVFRCWNGEKLMETVREAAENSDFVVAYIHWGTENQAELDWAQLKQAPELVAAGADLVIGDHPHCLQPIGVISGVPVIYSLGNFWFNSKTLDTGMVEVVIDETGIVRYQFIPCLQSGCRTALLEGAEKERVLSYMRSISEGVAIDGDGVVTW
ncbi:MAG: CapA family protein [Bacteroidales bacterium]|nr:CapA family protein [Bacteroidales bacterium]MCM1414868.1 CapA family protein [bacterium]MCM1424081.1 CapA family protein [bacterium]